MHKGFHRWKEQLLLLFFPHKCFLCGKVLSGSGWLCEHCTLPQTENLCLGCGKDRKNCICSRVSYDGAWAPLWYTAGARYGIHRFKYEGRTYYAAFLGELMAQGVQALWTEAFDCITYVPMSPKKQRARGYCQSELLAKEISRQLKIPVEKTLCHTAHSKSQMSQKGLEARIKNASCSFQRGEKDLQGLQILLVDDVLTTGATASYCAELLKAQGAVSVFVLTAATTGVKQYS